MKIQARLPDYPEVLFEKRGNWKEERGSRERLEREWGRSEKELPTLFLSPPLPPR